MVASEGYLNPLARLREEQRRALEQLLPDVEALPPPDSPLQWELRDCDPPPAARSPVTIAEARQMIRDEIDAYLKLERPEHMLLVRAAAGLGKTTLGVRTAELCATRGRRVAYVMPRHDFFGDLLAIAEHPRQWYEWLPRQDGDEAHPHTCDYAEIINGSWLARGYKGMDFCSRICGWDFVNNKCVYHAQKNKREPILAIQHQHLVLGHPADFSVVIGDENPMGSFMHEWRIPARHVMLTGLQYEDPLAELLYTLRNLCDNDKPLSGPALLAALGGADSVGKTAADNYYPPSLLSSPSIHHAHEAERIDYGHLPHLLGLLKRETAEALAGREYAARIWAGRGELTLLLRRDPAMLTGRKRPGHVIWLDATGAEHIYAELFGRPVKVVDPPVKMAGEIIVVADRANGKRTLSDEAGAPEPKFDDVRRIVERVVADGAFQQPGLITFQSLLKADWLQELQTANFYGARGTNRMEGCDVLFVAGAPLPPKSSLQKDAAMIYFRRMRPFNAPWTAQWVTYQFQDDAGRGRMYPAGGYWADPDMQALVWQYREAEILQSAHRARPLHRDVPVYLLVNVPIPELPVSQVITSRDILGVPGGADINLWLRFIDWVDGRESVTVSEIEEGMGMNWRTAAKYFESLGWEIGYVKSGGRGRPRAIATRKKELTAPTV